MKRQMNSRCICAETRDAAEKSARHGNRVEFPDFPGNREADDGAGDKMSQPLRRLP